MSVILVVIQRSRPLLLVAHLEAGEAAGARRLALPRLLLLLELLPRLQLAAAQVRRHEEVKKKKNLTRDRWQQAAVAVPPTWPATRAPAAGGHERPLDRSQAATSPAPSPSAAEMMTT